jgi:hypothetical protein
MKTKEPILSLYKISKHKYILLQQDFFLIFQYFADLKIRLVINILIKYDDDFAPIVGEAFFEQSQYFWHRIFVCRSN